MIGHHFRHRLGICNGRQWTLISCWSRSNRAESLADPRLVRLCQAWTSLPEHVILARADCAFLDRQIEATPELFPPEIRRGYRMKDTYTSRETG